MIYNCFKLKIVNIIVNHLILMTVFLKDHGKRHVDGTVYNGLLIKGGRFYLKNT